MSGLACGGLLFLASALQQMSLSLGTTSGKCGFITAMYMIFVPIAGIFLGRRIRPLVWPCALLSLVGMYFLTLSGENTLAIGDLCVLFSSFLYTAHILTLDAVVGAVDPIRLSCLQFLVAGLLGGAVTLFTGFPPLGAVVDALIPILYVGIFSSGVAYTLQVVGQRDCAAAIAPLLMSLESVFAALSGYVLGVEVLSAVQIGGCALIFLAVALLQLSEGLFSGKKTQISS